MQELVQIQRTLATWHFHDSWNDGSRIAACSPLPKKGIDHEAILFDQNDGVRVRGCGALRYRVQQRFD